MKFIPLPGEGAVELENLRSTLPCDRVCTHQLESLGDAEAPPTPVPCNILQAKLTQNSLSREIPGGFIAKESRGQQRAQPCQPEDTRRWIVALKHCNNTRLVGPFTSLSSWLQTAFSDLAVPSRYRKSQPSSSTGVPSLTNF